VSEKTVVHVDRFETPLGPMELAADEAGRLRAVGWIDRAKLSLSGAFTPVARANPFGLTAAFDAYFAGELRALEGIEVLPEGTDFQRAVWAALREIPCGQTWSYGQLAQHLGNPGAVRAVGRANGANPIPVVVPCHRVIGADGSLTGFGGGMERKRWLLAHESALPQGSLRLKTSSP
jgi:methylated-DNA-[protein]-cysteine S-methyltransferase